MSTASVHEGVPGVGEAAAGGGGALEAVHGVAMHVFEWVVLAVNVVCAAVLVWGVVVGVGLFLTCEARRTDRSASWSLLRRRVGHYLLFALELLIAADIIETMIRPTWQQLIVLAGVSALRIATGYALGKELEHLPGSRGAASETGEAVVP